jgi:hypothetical protein
MGEPAARHGRPPGGPRPPAPPGTGEPRPGPEPSDLGPPIGVYLRDMPLGDLGNARVDARLVVAILLHGGAVARLLSDQGVDTAAVERSFAGAKWPLEPTRAMPGIDEPDPADPDLVIDVWLDDLCLGEIGDAGADAALLGAILVRGRRVAEWLEQRGISADQVEAAFPGSSWS